MPGEVPAIPGYAFDQAKNRYFKITKTGLATKSSSSYSIAGQAKDARDRVRVKPNPRDALKPLAGTDVHDALMGLRDVDPRTMHSQHQAGQLGGWQERPSPARGDLSAVAATQDYFLAGCAHSGAVYLYKDERRGRNIDLGPHQLLAPVENYIYNSPSVSAYYAANTIAVARANGYKTIKLFAGTTLGTPKLEEVAELECDLPLLCHASKTELGVASSKKVMLYTATGSNTGPPSVIWQSRAKKDSSYSCLAAAGPLISGSVGVLLGRRDGTVVLADKRDCNLKFVRAAPKATRQRQCVTNVASTPMNQYTFMVSQLDQPGPALYDLRRGPESAPVLQYSAANYDQTHIGTTLSPSGAALATSDDQGSVMLFDTATGKHLSCPSEPWRENARENTRAVTSLAWGTQLAASYGGKLFITRKS